MKVMIQLASSSSEMYETIYQISILVDQQLVLDTFFSLAKTPGQDVSRIPGFNPSIFIWIAVILMQTPYISWLCSTPQYYSCQDETLQMIQA